MNAPADWTISIEKISKALGSPPRWRMLIALGQEEWLPASLLASRGRVSRTGASQHLRVLREAKIVEQGYGRLYRIAPALRGSLAEGWLDLGRARIRIRPEPIPEGALPPPGDG